MKTRTKIAVAATLSIAAVATWGIATAQQHGGGMHGLMSGLMGHDEIRMPMLNGRDTTQAEVAELRAMFVNHTAITRTVENLPNGIRTTTETADPELRDALVNHVVGMIGRVHEQRDPQIPIQSPTLSILFDRADAIETDMEPTDSGITVIQTSDDPQVVAALQKHAAEVSDLAARGMQSVHESMHGQHHGSD